MQILRLPNELLLLISSFLKKPSTINTLCQTNRRFAHVFTPLLHHLAIRNPSYGIVALHWSAAIGNEPLVRLILSNAKGIRVRDHRRKLLHRHTDKCNDVTVSKVMEEGARLLVYEDPDTRPRRRACRDSFFWAIQRRQEEVLRVLLELGAYVEGFNAGDENECGSHGDEGFFSKNTALHYAVISSNCAIVELFIKHNVWVDVPGRNGATPLHEAVHQSEKGIIKLLIDAGADIDSQDDDLRTVLHTAVGANDLPLVKLLLKNGADSCISVPDADGVTPLGSLLSSGEDTPMLMCLLRNANWDFVWEGSTALHIAAGRGFKGVIRQLLGNGVDIDAVDSDGYSALHLAVLNGHDEIAKALMTEGASIEFTDFIDGNTALDIATMTGNVEMVDYILWFGEMEDRAFDNLVEGHYRKGRRY